jgi:DnaJ-class molecular chaperone
MKSEIILEEEIICPECDGWGELGKDRDEVTIICGTCEGRGII